MNFICPVRGGLARIATRRLCLVRDCTLDRAKNAHQGPQATPTENQLTSRRAARSYIGFLPRAKGEVISHLQP